MRHEPLDCAGRRIEAGDIVRVIGVPDLSGMAPESRLESEPVFRHLLGTYRRVAGFDEYGHAGLWFSIRKGPLAGRHYVAMEPFLLRVRPTAS